MTRVALRSTISGMDHSVESENFRNAARFEPELTARQREVLRLIAAGKTNSEIADALGMTLAGAKWHVSELLTKLGLDSREEAAQYHRWRQAPQRRLSRRLHAILSVGALKLGLAGTGGAAAVGLGVALALAMHSENSDSGPAVPGLPFYMETVFTREETLYAYEAGHRYWYQDEEHQRVERGWPEVIRGSENVDFGSPPAIPFAAVIRDGENEWHPGPLYRRLPLEGRLGTRQSVPGATLGPLKYESVEQWLAAMEATGGEFELPSHYEIETSDSFLGRPVEVYVRRFPAEQRLGGSVGDRRVWIDRERLFILKTEISYSTPEGGTIRESEAVTKLVYGEAQPADRFLFVPEPGWVENHCESPADRPLLEPPAPFFTVPGQVGPTGHPPRSMGGTVAADGTCSTWRHEYGSVREQSEPSILIVRQEAGDRESVFSAPPSELIDLAGTEARLGNATDGGRSIAWVTPEVGIEIRSTTLTDAELVAFASAMVEANH